jgi:hypothetical protein
MHARRVRCAARLRPTAEFALVAVLSDTRANEAGVPHAIENCAYRLCGMADEVGRHARQVVGQIVEEIRDHSLLSGPKEGTSLNVPSLYPCLYPRMYPSWISDKAGKHEGRGHRRTTCGAVVI